MQADFANLIIVRRKERASGFLEGTNVADRKCYKYGNKYSAESNEA